jgi:hypothetical protein
MQIRGLKNVLDESNTIDAVRRASLLPVFFAWL